MAQEKRVVFMQDQAEDGPSPKDPSGEEESVVEEWRCPECHEVVDGDLDICWNCGTSSDGVRDPHFGVHPETRQREDPETKGDGLRQLAGGGLIILAIGLLYILSQKTIEAPEGKGWLENAPAYAVLALTASISSAYLGVRLLLGSKPQVSSLSDTGSEPLEKAADERTDVWTCPDCGATNSVELLRCWKCGPSRPTEQALRAKQPEVPARSLSKLQQALVMGGATLFSIAVLWSGYVVYREISARPQDTDFILRDIAQMVAAAAAIVIFLAIAEFAWRKR